MVKLKINVILLVAIVAVCSCSFLSSGYNNEHGQFVPKHPHFRLKDKKQHRIPDDLDTINIYKLNYRFSFGIETYPSDAYDDESGMLKYAFCLKFYGKGRCMFFGVDPYQIMENDLNPNNSYCSKEYFYSKDGQTFYIESYFNNQGYGHYMISKYKINKTGDTIIKIGKNSKDIYVREILPKHWKKYPVDW